MVRGGGVKKERLGLDWETPRGYRRIQEHQNDPRQPKPEAFGEGFLFHGLTSSTVKVTLYFFPYSRHSVTSSIPETLLRESSRAISSRERNFSL